MEQTSFHQENFRRRTRYTAVFLILAAVFCVVTVLNINTGNVHIPVPKILRILFLKEGAATEYNIIWKIRLPRILMAANSAQTEAACAGALNLRLAGDASYFGKIVKKPYIGDDIRPVEAEDIARVNVLLYRSAVIGECLCLLILMGITLFI